MFSKYFLSAQSFIMWVLFLDNYSTLFNANESREVVCEWGRLWKQNTCSQKPLTAPGMVGHSVIPVLRRRRKTELTASTGYMVSLKTAWAT